MLEIVNKNKDQALRVANERYEKGKAPYDVVRDYEQLYVSLFVD